MPIIDVSTISLSVRSSRRSRAQIRVVCAKEVSDVCKALVDRITSMLKEMDIGFSVNAMPAYEVREEYNPETGEVERKREVWGVRYYINLEV